MVLLCYTHGSDFSTNIRNGPDYLGFNNSTNEYNIPSKVILFDREEGHIIASGNYFHQSSEINFLIFFPISYLLSAKNKIK